MITYALQDPMKALHAAAFDSLRGASTSLMDMILPHTWFLLLSKFHSYDVEANSYYKVYS